MIRQPVRMRLREPRQARQVPGGSGRRRHGAPSAFSTATAVLAVAGIAAYVSCWHAYAVVRAHGESGITARLEPATIEGLVYAVRWSSCTRPGIGCRYPALTLRLCKEPVHAAGHLQPELQAHLIGHQPGPQRPGDLRYPLQPCGQFAAVAHVRRVAVQRHQVTGTCRALTRVWRVDCGCG
jgi:hypothetical protein